MQLFAKTCWLLHAAVRLRSVDAVPRAGGRDGVKRRLVEAAPGAAAIPARRQAVCVAGAVRSLIEHEVYESMWRFFSAGGVVDLYFHLYTGVELSARGQRNLTVAQLPELQEAIKGAKSVRFQVSENRFTCGQMSTGKFYKIEMCAKLIQETMRKHANLTYDALIVTRPDLHYIDPERSSMAPHVERVASRGPDSFERLGNEMFVASFVKGLELASSMTRATCCNVKKRLPKPCFFATRAMSAPRVNFIQESYFAGKMHVVANPKHTGPYFIVRSSDEEAEIANRSWTELHGLTKPGVETSDEPILSPPILDWHLLSHAEQETWLSSYMLK